LSHELQRALKDDIFDVVFTRITPDDDDEVIIEKLFQEPLIAVFPNGHAQADSENPISHMK